MNIGILGGTFDPIHNGHLHIAGRASVLFQLKEVWFVPAQVPPHKRGEFISSPFHRFAMVALAIGAHPRFRVSTLELEPGASPYTVDTLAVLSQSLNVAPHRLYFIAGGDSFCCIPTWKNFEELIANYNMLFIERPDSRIEPGRLGLPESVNARITDLRHLGPHLVIPPGMLETRQGMTRTYLLQLDAPEISSTTIRGRCPLSGADRNLVPPEVADYINRHQLYAK